MKKLYEKSEITFAILWIVVYCVLLSVGDAVSANIGTEKAVTLPIAAALSVILFIYIKKSGLTKKYGICKPAVSASRLLFYIPLLLLLSVNLWFGININLSLTETVLYILTMLCVGFLEETIFRGLLFKAMAQNGLKSAIVISSLSFGMGHIINLFNGSGAELVPNLLQIVYAAATGFMLVMLYCKSESLISCIVFHGVFNALSVFSREDAMTLGSEVASCAFIVLISVGYGVYLIRSIKTEATETDKK